MPDSDSIAWDLLLVGGVEIDCVLGGYNLYEWLLYGNLLGVEGGGVAGGPLGGAFLHPITNSC